MIKTPSFPLFILLLLCSCSSNSQRDKNNKVTLLFVGDLMQHQGQIDAARTPQGRLFSLFQISERQKLTVQTLPLVILK